MLETTYILLCFKRSLFLRKHTFRVSIATVITVSIISIHPLITIILMMPPSILEAVLDDVLPTTVESTLMSTCTEEVIAGISVVSVTSGALIIATVYKNIIIIHKMMWHA